MMTELMAGDGREAPAAEVYRCVICGAALPPAQPGEDERNYCADATGAPIDCRPTVTLDGRKFVRDPALHGGTEWRRLGDGRWRHDGASYRCGEEFWPLLDALATLTREADEKARETDGLRETLEHVEHEVAEVYTTLTEGRFAKCNTEAMYVIDCVNELWERDAKELSEIADALRVRMAGLEVDLARLRWRVVRDHNVYELADQPGRWVAHNGKQALRGGQPLFIGESMDEAVDLARTPHDGEATAARPHQHAFYESGVRDVAECDCGNVAYVGPDGTLRDATPTAPEAEC